MVKIVVLKRDIYSFRNKITNKKLMVDFSNLVSEWIILSEKKEAIKIEIELMEKEILYFKGKKRERAKRAYYRLLRTCGKKCALTEPIYLKRSE